MERKIVRMSLQTLQHLCKSIELHIQQRPITSGAKGAPQIATVGDFNINFLKFYLITTHNFLWTKVRFR